MQVEFLITTHNSILTMGAMGPVGGSVGKGALVAGASAAASTASIAAVNSSMNADGDVFKQLKTISKDTWDETTSKESVRNTEKIMKNFLLHYSQVASKKIKDMIWPIMG